MPYMVNPSGVVVCVPEDEVESAKASFPVKYLRGGKLAASRGFRDATRAEIDALHEKERKAAELAGKEAAEEAVRSKSFVDNIVKGFSMLAGHGEEKEKKHGKG